MPCDSKYTATGGPPAWLTKLVKPAKTPVNTPAKAGYSRSFGLKNPKDLNDCQATKTNDTIPSKMRSISASANLYSQTPPITPGNPPMITVLEACHDHFRQYDGRTTTSVSMNSGRVTPKATAGSTTVAKTAAPAKLAPDPKPAFEKPENSMAAPAITKKVKLYSMWSTCKNPEPVQHNSPIIRDNAPFKSIKSSTCSLGTARNWVYPHCELTFEEHLHGTT